MAIALIVAGGQGLRMQMAVRKQYLEIEGKPLLHHTLTVFDRCAAIDRIILVVPASDRDFCRQQIVETAGLSGDVLLVDGGEERQQSVHNGLRAMTSDLDDIVVIHDGVRPFIEERHIIDCIQAALACGASVLGVPVSDTIKQSDADGHIKRTIDRSHLWVAQTPQAFRYGLIRKAHDDAERQGMRATDDASLVEALGLPVTLVPGSRKNIKITTKEDLAFVSSLIVNTSDNN